MFSMTEKYIKTGDFEDKRRKDRGSYKGFCLVFCLSLLKGSVKVREYSRVLLGCIHLPSPGTCPSLSVLPNSTANCFYLICRCSDTIRSYSNKICGIASSS